MTKIPDGAQVVDAHGKVIMPGLVDSHSHIGGGAGGDNSGPIQPETRIIDSINVGDSSMNRARAGGKRSVRPCGPAAEPKQGGAAETFVREQAAEAPYPGSRINRISVRRVVEKRMPPRFA